ncbi:immunoglobulin iota chain-like isoform X2 [Passer montanus]|uniref:immunoglobulin iota chain-like isoform X2 n=1 Tax=Passer montanus TaxID=9160 RepID=UPI001960626E|nr:immunoglobulin iota chain-like isoform X2 [Passer montanus]
MRRARGAALPALAALIIVAMVRAQVQQEPFLETTEGTGINITCSHSKIQTSDWIQWYRQLPGREPEILAVIMKDSKELPDSASRVWVSADRRRSALWLGRPRRGDAAVYYCALGPRAEEPGLRPGTNRRGRGRAGPAGGAAAPARPGLRHRDRHRHRQWTSAPEPAPPRTQAPVAIPVLAPTTAPTPAPAPAFSHRPCSAPLLSPGCVRLSCSSHQTAPPGHSYMCTL